MELTLDLVLPDGTVHELVVRDPAGATARAVAENLVEQLAAELPGGMRKPVLYCERLDEPLSPSRSLLAAGVVDGDVLRLVDVAAPTTVPAGTPADAQARTAPLGPEHPTAEQSAPESAPARRRSRRARTFALSSLAVVAVAAIGAAALISTRDDDTPTTRAAERPTTTTAVADEREAARRLFENGTADGLAAACGDCHSLSDVGTPEGVGPGLDDVATRLGVTGIRTAILDPEREVAPGYPAGVHPQDYAETLTGAQLESLVDYLAVVATAAPPPTPPQAATGTATTEQTPPAASAPTTSLTRGDYVQLGSFRTDSGAQGEVDRLRASGIDAQTLRSNLAAELMPAFTVVAAGPVAGRRQERQLLRAAKRAGIAGAHVRSLTPAVADPDPASLEGSFDADDLIQRSSSEPRLNRDVSATMSFGAGGASGTVVYRRPRCTAELALLPGNGGPVLEYEETVTSGRCTNGGVWSVRPRAGEVFATWWHEDRTYFVTGSLAWSGG